MSRASEAPSLPVWAIKGFDSLSIKIFYSLLVRSADSVLGACISIESVDSLGDTHLGGCHGCAVVRTVVFCISGLCSPRRESKYPFASFCKRFAADSIVRYRLPKD